MERLHSRVSPSGGFPAVDLGEQRVPEVVRDRCDRAARATGPPRRGEPQHREDAQRPAPRDSAWRRPPCPPRSTPRVGAEEQEPGDDEEQRDPDVEPRQQAGEEAFSAAPLWNPTWVVRTTSAPTRRGCPSSPRNVSGAGPGSGDVGVLTGGGVSDLDVTDADVRSLVETLETTCYPPPQRFDGADLAEALGEAAPPVSAPPSRIVARVARSAR